jgi:hypothetical protein
MQKQKQEGALALVSWSSFLCRTQADVASVLLAKIQMKLLSGMEESSKRRWRERYQGRHWVSRTRGSRTAIRLGGRFPDLLRSHQIPSLTRDLHASGLPKITTPCRKLGAGDTQMSIRRGVSYVPCPKSQASGNPGHCRQFGFVPNALDPKTGPSGPFTFEGLRQYIHDFQ